MKWFDQNPHGSDASFLQRARWGAHKFGRQHFASNFARGGFAATAFAPTAGEAFVSPWRSKPGYGSPQHISNLRKIQSAYPDNKRISKAIKAAESTTVKSSILGTAARVGLGLAFVSAPFFTTPGNLYEKTKGSISSAAAGLGWEAGSKLGLGIGAAVGGPIGAALGYVGGGIIGGIAAEFTTSRVLETTDRMVQRERDKRNLNWVNDQTAFMTQGAFTMRQQSLQAMNRGMMNARSMLGREGIMLHQ